MASLSTREVPWPEVFHVPTRIEMRVVCWYLYGAGMSSNQSLDSEYRSKAACERVMASLSPANGAVLLCMD
jgi:hypothetical protein